jgi:hypothetical protein
VRAVACPCVSPSNESRVVFAEMAPGARGGGVTFRTRPRKQGVYPPPPPRWQVTDLSLVAVFLVWRDAPGADRRCTPAHCLVLLTGVLQGEAGSNVTRNFTV